MESEEQKQNAALVPNEPDQKAAVLTPRSQLKSRYKPRVKFQANDEQNQSSVPKSVGHLPSNAMGERDYTFYLDVAIPEGA